jgi:hypothetical protein
MNNLPLISSSVGGSLLILGIVLVTYSAGVFVARRRDRRKQREQQRNEAAREALRDGDLDVEFYGRPESWVNGEPATPESSPTRRRPD